MSPDPEAPEPGALPRRIVTLLTDFGDRDGFAGVVRGVVASRAPAATVLDLTHAIEPHDVVAGALVLASAVDHFAPGTIHLAVVDPGVGGPRRAIAIETEAFFLVGPDNGLLEPASRRSPVRGIVELDRTSWHGPRRSASFHGRDVFAPVAAHLARGIALPDLGTPLRTIERLGLPVPEVGERRAHGEVVHVDRFGNLVTNLAVTDLDTIATAPFRRSDLSITIAGVRIAGVSSHYAAVQRDALLALVNSWDCLEIAVRDGSAATRLGVGRGATIDVSTVRA